MIDLDELATTYVDELAIPPGPGIEAIRAGGRRRRRRVRVMSVVAAIVVVAAVGAGVVSIRVGRPLSVSAVDKAPGELAVLIDMDDELQVLDDWAIDEIPLMPTPSLPGWTTETIAMTPPSRFYEVGPHATYRLQRGGEELEVSVLPGQIDLGDETIALDRPDGTVDADLRERRDESRLHWNERPGVNTGTAVAISGDATETVVAAGTQLVLDDLPLTGATSPEVQPLDPDRSIIIQGTTSGTPWQISRQDRELPVLEVAGVAPRAVSGIDWEGMPGPEVMITSVGLDRRQINMIRVPDGASVELVGPERSRIDLPTVAVAGTTYSIAVAPIPAGKQASVIVVRTTDGTETSIGLPWIPTSGWSTAFLKRGTNGS